MGFKAWPLRTVTSRFSTIAMMMRIAGSVLLTGVLGFAVLTWFAMDRVRVGGVDFTAISSGKDYLADILPPPLFPIEAFVIAGEITGKVGDAAAERASIRQLKEAFDQQFLLGGLSRRRSSDRCG